MCICMYVNKIILLVCFWLVYFEKKNQLNKSHAITTRLSDPRNPWRRWFHHILILKQSCVAALKILPLISTPRLESYQKLQHINNQQPNISGHHYYSHQSVHHFHSHNTATSWLPTPTKHAFSPSHHLRYWVTITFTGYQFCHQINGTPWLPANKKQVMDEVH